MYHQRRPESREIRIGKIPDRLGLNISGTQALRLEYPANYTGRIGLYLFRVASNRISAAIAAGVIAPLLSAAPEYVDAKLCKQCHGRITEDFARTGMGRVFRNTAVTLLAELRVDVFRRGREQRRYDARGNRGGYPVRSHPE